MPFPPRKPLKEDGHLSPMSDKAPGLRLSFSRMFTEKHNGIALQPPELAQKYRNSSLS